MQPQPMQPLSPRALAKLLGLSHNQIRGLIIKHKIKPLLTNQGPHNASLYNPYDFTDLRDYPHEQRTKPMNKELSDAYLQHLHSQQKPKT